MYNVSMNNKLLCSSWAELDLGTSLGYICEKLKNVVRRVVALQVVPHGQGRNGKLCFEKRKVLSNAISFSSTEWHELGVDILFASIDKALRDKVVRAFPEIWVAVHCIRVYQQDCISNAIAIVTLVCVMTLSRKSGCWWIQPKRLFNHCIKIDTCLQLFVRGRNLRVGPDAIFFQLQSDSLSTPRGVG